MEKKKVLLSEPSSIFKIITSSIVHSAASHQKSFENHRISVRRNFAGR